MTAGADLRLVVPNMGSSHANYAFGLDADGLGSQPRMFKKHKTLPHPRRDDLQRSGLWNYGLGSDASLSQSGGSPASSPYVRQTRRTGRGPEPPPTPPAHSRTSSSSHPTDLSGPTCTSGPSRSKDNIPSRPPVTPPNQQTPPTPNLTPDRTPPGAAAHQTQSRPSINDRIPSKNTTDSRTESFRTARENPYSSDDDDGRLTLRPILPSAKTSQTTVRQLSREPRGPRTVGLGLGLESNPSDDLTPRTTGEFNTFDGEWASGETGASEVEEQWDDNLWRNVTVRKKRPTVSREARRETIDDMTATPTNATKALRSTSLQESPVLYSSRRVVSDRLPNQAVPSHSDSSSSVDYKRSSVMSTRSTASTVVEAILVETAPQRRKTLRHVRKQSTLRDSGSEVSPSSSAPTSVSTAVDGHRRLNPAESRVSDVARQSHASTATCNSISSRTARREVWKSGGIPVVVVPDRRSSIGANNRPPSLRSTSSRRSQRSQSLSSAHLSQTPKSKDGVPHFERSHRRSRALSESDGSRAGDERTMDFPPVIPTRSSSLSAPTSRNASRTGSLTAESMKAHNTLHAQQAHQALQKASRELDKLYSRNQPSASGEKPRDWKRIDRQPPPLLVEADQPTVLVQHARDERHDLVEERPSQSSRGHVAHDAPEEHGYGLGGDGYDDSVSGKRLSVHNTPFSVASVETTGTSHAEVSEALAVNIYPHQSKSVMLVDHSTKPSESSSLEQPKTLLGPEIKINVANDSVPATPPQKFSVDDVDSPLRNPRAPPEPPKPPAINFIPATPSGLTPTVEKERQLGNYYEMTQEKPKRSLSLLRRTLTRRRTSEYGPSPARPVGLLTRTLSLSRNIRRRPGDWLDDDGGRRPRLKRRSTADDAPPDESRLHPFWRPSYIEDEDSEEEDDDGWMEDDPAEERTYKYPPIDNRPALPRRSLSARLKRTFAILPLRDDHHDRYYPATEHDATDRRTIRRTPSGNLRVMKFRRSMESLTRISPPEDDGRPYTAPEHQEPQGREGRYERRYASIWRSLSVRSRRSPSRLNDVGVGVWAGAAEAGKDKGGGFLPALGDKINIPRRLSEKRREKRTQELRRMISRPREVRDGVDDVIRTRGERAYRGANGQPKPQQF
ncbi:hypothetical protein MFIFM68171_04141 [Madurella fahalii]|uniref:Uncharacterized protein n=1 Tax=Madurella fahalii TaxID=1157608 RepID=A0ABQ0G881_9PEZI